MGLIKTDSRLKRWESFSENWMLGLSLLFLGILILPSAHPLSTLWKSNLHRADLAIWIIFGLDYLGKLIISPDKRVFFKSHVFELLIVAIPLFRPLRILRLIPLIGYFLKYSKRSLSGRLLQYASLAAILVTVPAAVLMYQIERSAPNSNIKTLGDATWWATATVTTVGYGDRFPTTNIGRVLAVLVMLVGISLVGVITASVASWFVKSDADHSQEIQIVKLLERLESIERTLTGATTSSIEDQADK